MFCCIDTFQNVCHTKNKEVIAMNNTLHLYNRDRVQVAACLLYTSDAADD